MTGNIPSIKVLFFFIRSSLCLGSVLQLSDDITILTSCNSISKNGKLHLECCKCTTCSRRGWRKSKKRGEKSRVVSLFLPCHVSLVTTQNEASEDALVEQGLRRTPPPGPLVGYLAQPG